MTFEPLPSFLPSMRVWGAQRDNCTFVVTQDDMHEGAVTASVKIGNERTIELGVFGSVQDAVTACESWRVQ